jgi:hypothetical protein
MSERRVRMKFHIFRCVGIIAFGFAMLFLAAMVSPEYYQFFKQIYRYDMDILIGFIVSLFLAAVFLSLEQEKKE